jgi:hypothetical protein
MFQERTEFVQVKDGRYFGGKVKVTISSLLSVAFGDLAVTCLKLDPRFAISNPAVDEGFLSLIEYRSSTSLGGEVKPSVSCRSILQNVKEPYEYERDIP